MIRGYLRGLPDRLRPFVNAQVSIPSQQVSGEVRFLIDTGADATTLSPADSQRLGVDTRQLPQGIPTRGVGGTMQTVYVPMIVNLGARAFTGPIPMLTPAGQSH
jgi:predicted aspartyl protease